MPFTRQKLPLLAKMTSTLPALWNFLLSLKLRLLTTINQGRCDCEMKQPRRSACYHPTIWETNQIESFVTPYTYDLHVGRLEELKQITSWTLKATNDHFVLLKLIDSAQRLGLAYHFEDEIREAISRLYQDEITSNNLHLMALRFRVLREHGLSASSDVFDRFRGRDGRFSESLSSDVEGLLSLYEASHLGVPGEVVMEEAKSFTAKKLKQYCSSIVGIKIYLAEKVEESLENPLYWMLPRLEARNFIDLYELYPEKITNLLELAELDYNLVQSVYQQELKELACWWRDLGFKENLKFARDRLMENYLWAMGIIFEPHLSKCRISATKFVCILTAIDDMYDVYGSLDELECFTNAVKRWDMEAIKHLPFYMKICYLAMLNFGNGLIYDVLKTHGLDVSSYIKEEWLSLCRSYLVEARWFYGGYIPSVEEYLENACISVGGHAGVVHACVLDHSILRSSLENCLNRGSELIHWSSLIARLSDDLGTSKDESKRGDVAKAVQCYMVEKGISEEEAINHIKELISYAWKMMNKEMISCNGKSLPNSFVRMCLNMARTAHCIFQHGDGIGTSFGVTKDRLVSLIVTPVPLTRPILSKEE